MHASYILKKVYHPSMFPPLLFIHFNSKFYFSIKKRKGNSMDSLESSSAAANPDVVLVEASASAPGITVSNKYIRGDGAAARPSHYTWLNEGIFKDATILEPFKVKKRQPICATFSFIFIFLRFSFLPLRI